MCPLCRGGVGKEWREAAVPQRNDGMAPTLTAVSDMVLALLRSKTVSAMVTALVTPYSASAPAEPLYALLL